MFDGGHGFGLEVPSQGLYGQFPLTLLLSAGGSTASPILSVLGSISLRNDLTPSFALSISGHEPFGPDGVHMEPVRSRTIMMSRGFTTHGAHAVASALTVILVMPMIRPNHVGTFAVA